MRISQLQVASDSVQDRLALRIATEANEESRIHLKRRFLHELLPHLTAMPAGNLGAIAANPQSVQIKSLRNQAKLT